MTLQITRQWYRTATSDPLSGATAIPGATGLAYIAQTADVAKYLHFRESATNAAGAAVAPAISNVVGPITAIGDVWVAENGRVAPLALTPSGNQPIELRFSPAEIAQMDGELAAHNSLHSLMHLAPLQTQAIADGYWSDPAIWSNGVPVAGGSAQIPYGRTVTYDVESNAQLKFVMFHGTFRVARNVDTKLVVDTVHGSPGSWFDWGTPWDPVPESATAGKPRSTIVFKGDAPGGTMRLGLMTMGKVTIHGAVKQEKVDLEIGPAAGASQIKVKTGVSISTWRVGETLLILSRDARTGTFNDTTYTGPTTYYLKQFYPENSADFPATQVQGFKASHDEIRTITAIDPATNTITLNAPLTYAHPHRQSNLTWKDGTKAFLPARVCNLSRSIQFESGGNLSNLQERAHTMFMSCDYVDARWARAKNMARTDTNPSLTSINSPALTSDPAGNNPINDPNNVIGRYAWHIHGIGRNMQREMAIFEGLVADADPGAPPQPGWAITHHNSRAAIERCTVYNVRGAGIVSELGTEVGQWVNNTVAWARGDGFHPEHATRAQHIANHNGHAGVAYDFQARNIYVSGCEFTSCHFGFVYLVNEDINQGIQRAAEHDAMRLFNPLVGGLVGWNNSGNTDFGEGGYGLNQPQIPALDHSHAADFGTYMLVAHRGSYREDMTPLISDGIIAYGGDRVLEFTNYTWHYMFKNFAFFGGKGGDGLAVNAGAKTGTFHYLNGIIEGWATAYNDRDLIDGRLVDVNTDGAVPAIMQRVNSSNLSNVTPSFTLDTTTDYFNASLPGLTGYKTKLTLDYYEGRGGGDPYKGPVRVRGTLTDAIGPRKWPHYQPDLRQDHDEVVFEHISSRAMPATLVRRNGCFNDSGVWKMPCYFVDVDRAKGDHVVIRVDVTLTNFPADFLAANTVVPTPPAFPMLPESISKPRPSKAVPAVQTAPVIPLLLTGVPAACWPGKWSGTPDTYTFSWRKGGIEISNARVYTPVAADEGQTVTCEVTAYNSAGKSVAAPSNPRTSAALGSTPDTIFGTALKDVWTCDDGEVAYLRTPKMDEAWTQPNGRGVRVHMDNLGVEWRGRNGTRLGIYNNDANHSPIYDRNGWFDSTPCLLMNGNPGNGDDWRNFLDGPIGSGNTAIHLWVVMERSADNQTSSGPDERFIFNFGDNISVYMLQPSADAAQNAVRANGNAAHNRTSLPKGTRAAIYGGRNSVGVTIGVNNVRTTDNSGPMTNGNRNLSVGNKAYNPRTAMRGKVKAIYWVEQDVVSTQQFADMHAYIQRRHGV